MDSVGLIDLERLQLIPKKYWKAHEFCFFIHDRLADLLVEYDVNQVQESVAIAFRDAIAGREEEFKDVDLLEFLKDESTDLYRQHIIGHVVVALTADMLHFLFEALRCFEKRKFSVGFSVLRKPLKEHLLYLAWILADENDFVQRFSSRNYETLNSVPSERRLEIFSHAIDKLRIGEAFDANLLSEILYSKQHSYGFEPTWQRATHLITSMGDLLKTEDYSFNFVFDDAGQDDYYEFLYSKLPYVLTFLSQVTLEAFDRVLKVSPRAFSHFAIVVMGCYDAMFLKRGRQPIAATLRRHFAYFLKCSHCDSPLRFTRKTAPMLYMSEQLPCSRCGTLAEVPLYYILSFAKIELERSAKGDELARSAEKA
jgi:hypothetical protein